MFCQRDPTTQVGQRSCFLGLFPDYCTHLIVNLEKSAFWTCFWCKVGFLKGLDVKVDPLPYIHIFYSGSGVVFFVNFKSKRRIVIVKWNLKSYACPQLEGVMLCEAQGWRTGRAKALVRSYLGSVPIPKLGPGFRRGGVTSVLKHSRALCRPVPIQLGQACNATQVQLLPKCSCILHYNDLADINAI